jgi:hypothetical protein
MCIRVGIDVDEEVGMFCPILRMRGWIPGRTLRQWEAVDISSTFSTSKHHA